MAEARKKELEFFKGSRHYSDLKNVGTGFLSSKLSTHLINAIRKQLPVIQHSINDGIINLERELEALGGPAVTTRGAMVHLILQVCIPAQSAICIPIRVTRTPDTSFGPQHRSCDCTVIAVALPLIMKGCLQGRGRGGKTPGLASFGSKLKTSMPQIRSCHATNPHNVQARFAD